MKHVLSPLFITCHTSAEHDHHTVLTQYLYNMPSTKQYQLLIDTRKNSKQGCHEKFYRKPILWKIHRNFDN